MGDNLIRLATEADIATVTAIYADAVLHGTGTFEIEPPGESEMARRMQELFDGGYPYLVADAGGDVLGYAYAGAYHRRPAYRTTVEDSVYVLAEARGRGIGRALLAALIDESEACGFRQMIAIIGDSGNVASLRLHRAAGFVPVGRFINVGFKFGRWLDTVLMQRALGPGSETLPASG